jgi:LuxR family transcriptional regulator, maltose regulon positive regulatory protein
VVELDDVFLDAKLSIPLSRPGSVSRAALIERARASDCRVVGVTAPAGYGKSTFLTEWAHAEERPVGWVSLDRFDDDPAILLVLLASAYARVQPDRADLVGEVSGPGMSVLGRGAPRLASAYRTSPVPFVIMLDDFHELRSPDCRDVLGVVMSGIPRGSQFIAAGRSEQPHLPRLRASGDALEFVAADLALDAAGAAQVFAAASVGLDDELAAAVTERTEGWPVGLYLAALIAKANGGQAWSVTGDDRYVADYLYRESLAHQPEETQRFLRQTAVVDQVCAPLCDALLGEHNADAQLRHLESTSLFVVPLDRRREWFRYHGLFREFLLAELRRHEPDIVEKLHLRAADWYEANGSPALALEHLLDTTERDRSVQLLTALIQPTYQAGQLSTAQRWLSAIGGSAIEQYPPLAVLAGWVAALAGNTAETERLAAIIDAATFDLVPVDGTASFDSSRAMFQSLTCPAGPERAVTDGLLAVAAEPRWSPWRDQAVAICGEALLLAGDVDGATEMYVEALEAGAACPSDAFVVAASELSLLAMDRGRWSEADDHLQLALDAIDAYRMHDYCTSVLAFAASARLSLHRGDANEANRRLTQAMRTRPSSTYALPGIAVRGRLQVAKVYWALADHTAARHLLREIDDILLRRPKLGALVEEVSEFRNITAADHARATAASPLTPAELRLLPYLQTHLTIREIGERLFVSRNTVSSEIGSIYRKLGVSSRSDAVDRATAIGLLGA